MTAQHQGADLLLRRQRGGIARLTLNDPDRANALSMAMIGQLTKAIGDAAGDASVAVVVIGAAGRIFCAGHDLAELRATEDGAEHRRIFDRCSDLMRAIVDCPKPVIASVTGAAVAAGCQLVASCDLAYAEERSRFAVSGIDLGLFCSTPAVAVSRAIGRKSALEMLFTGRFVTAAEAASIGLINRAVASDELEGVVDAVAASIAAKPPEAVALGKALFNRQIEMDLKEAYGLAGACMAENLSFPSARSGIDAFLNRSGR
ncbi:MAG TPA: enoyl-CoA hydratase [Caulobacteraceae bacterium]